MSLAGAVLRPGDPAYAEALATDNHSVTHHPRAVVVPAGPADLPEAVALARREGGSLGVQLTGHGMTVPAEGVLLDPRRLGAVRVDPERRTLRVGAGVRWRDVLAQTARHGLAPLSGSSPHVGVVGYLLGGGIGMLGRQHGYAADHVLGLTAVTADGAVHELGEDHEPELLEAVLGSRGQLALVAGATLRLFPVLGLIGGGLWFDGPDDVLPAYVAWSATLPRETSTSLLVVRLPDGAHLVHLRFAHFGDPAQVDDLLAPVRAAGALTQDTVGPLSYDEIGTIHQEPLGPYAVHESGLFTGPPGDVEVAALLEAVAGGLLVELRHHGEAYADAPVSPNVVGGRDAACTVYLSSPPEAAAQHDAVRSRLAGVDRGSVLSFLGAGSSVEQVRSGFAPGGWEKVRAAKRRWDPDDLFRVTLPLGP